MQCLIDGDILLYEISAISEYKTEEGETLPQPFQKAAEKFDAAVERLCFATNAKEKPLMYLTGKTNFREDVATIKDYKGTRKADKPFHYHNLKAYAIAVYGAIIKEGLEADDLLSIEQCSRLHLKDTVICSRDKDLRMVPGYHYQWECGRQPSFGPAWVTELGTLRLATNRKKVIGTGLKFFYAQCLMGDTVDNIAGAGGYGPVKTWGALEGLETQEELEQKVLSIYTDKYGAEEGGRRLTEMGKLLWMVREVKDNLPVMWNIKQENV